jgi:dTMP kinase
MRGRFVVIEGVDGVGKTTQEGLLRAAVQKAGYEVHCTKQPTDWYRSQDTVRAFLNSGEKLCPLEVLALMSAADRLYHVANVIEPLLAQGAWVICNRYVYSAIAYFQVRGVEAEFVEYINRFVPRPDYGILLVSDPQLALDRLTKRDGANRKWEERDPSYLGAVQSALLTTWPREFPIFKAASTESFIAAEIANYVLPSNARTQQSTYEKS